MLSLHQRCRCSMIQSHDTTTKHHFKQRRRRSPRLQCRTVPLIATICLFCLALSALSVAAASVNEAAQPSPAFLHHRVKHGTSRTTTPTTATTPQPSSTSVPTLVHGQTLSPTLLGFSDETPKSILPIRNDDQSSLPPTRSNSPSPFILPSSSITAPPLVVKYAQQVPQEPTVTPSPACNPFDTTSPSLPGRQVKNRRKKKGPRRRHVLCPRNAPPQTTIPSVTPTANSHTPSITTKPTASSSPTRSSHPTITGFPTVTAFPTSTWSPSSSLLPTRSPSSRQSQNTTTTPTTRPSTKALLAKPSISPTVTSRVPPTVLPTVSLKPTFAPSQTPSLLPSLSPTVAAKPTLVPSESPTSQSSPSSLPTTTLLPTVAKNASPTTLPTTTMRPTVTFQPTLVSASPTISFMPTVSIPSEGGTPTVKPPSKKRKPIMVQPTLKVLRNSNETTIPSASPSITSLPTVSIESMSGLPSNNKTVSPHSPTFASHHNKTTPSSSSSSAPTLTISPTISSFATFMPSKRAATLTNHNHTTNSSQTKTKHPTTNSSTSPTYNNTIHRPTHLPTKHPPQQQSDFPSNSPSQIPSTATPSTVPSVAVVTSTTPKQNFSILVLLQLDQHPNEVGLTLQKVLLSEGPSYKNVTIQFQSVKKIVPGTFQKANAQVVQRFSVPSDPNGLYQLILHDVTGDGLGRTGYYEIYLGGNPQVAATAALSNATNTSQSDPLLVNNNTSAVMIHGSGRFATRRYTFRAMEHYNTNINNNNNNNNSTAQQQSGGKNSTTTATTRLLQLVITFGDTPSDIGWVLAQPKYDSNSNNNNVSTAVGGGASMLSTIKGGNATTTNSVVEVADFGPTIFYRANLRFQSLTETIELPLAATTTTSTKGDTSPLQLIFYDSGFGPPGFDTSFALYDATTPSSSEQRRTTSKNATTTTPRVLLAAGKVSNGASQVVDFIIGKPFVSNTGMPSSAPSLSVSSSTPSTVPSNHPSDTPSLTPSTRPSIALSTSDNPSDTPSSIPSYNPSNIPSSVPSYSPSASSLLANKTTTALEPVAGQTPSPTSSPSIPSKPTAKTSGATTTSFSCCRMIWNANFAIGMILLYLFGIG